MIRALTAFTIVFSAAAAAYGQAVERRIEEIRKIYSETNGLITEMREAPELSSVFSIELVVNKDLAPYPAVGIYQTTAVFYYSYSDRERNPYPDRLIKVGTVTKRSAREKVAEYYFDKAGDAVFVFISEPGGDVVEKRLYFTAGRLIRMLVDGKETGPKTRAAVSAAAAAKKESARLMRIFTAALASES